MNNQYMPKYVKVKQIKRQDGSVCYLEKDHINAIEDTLLYEDSTIGNVVEKAGTDLLEVIRHVADGSSSTECKIASISANGQKLPIDAQKNVDITIPKNVEDGAQINKIETININGLDLTIDTNKKAKGLVKSTLPIPNEISSLPLTTLGFCNLIADLDTCKVGVIYSGYSRITDAPCNGCEVTISVMKDESNTAYPRNKVFVLRMNSTNHHEKNWITMYHNEEMKYGTNDCPWEAELLTPVSKSTDTDDWIGASKKYVKDTVVVKQVSITESGNAIVNAQLDVNGKLTLTKGTVGGVDEASSTDVQNGTVANKMVTPNRTAESVKFGLLHNADKIAGGTSLASTDQKKVQNWLGTQQLLFTFNDNTTRTFNFVCNEVVS